MLSVRLRGARRVGCWPTGGVVVWCHHHQGAKQIQTFPDTFSLEVSSCEEKYFSQIQQKYGYPPIFNQR